MLKATLAPIGNRWRTEPTRAPRKASHRDQTRARSCSAKQYPCCSNVFHALAQLDATMFMGPERRKQNQLARFRLNLYPLPAEFRLTAWARHIIQVPDSNELTRTEGMAATVYMPVIELPPD